MKTTYNNLKELLLGITGALDPYQWAKGVYKAIGCGPWVSFEMDDGSEVYYEDAPREDDNVAHLLEHCVGLKLGSIVEGSDVEVGPVELMFPFTDEDLNTHLQALNDEATFYWNRDNTTYYSIRPKKDPESVDYWCQWTEWDPLPKGSWDEEDQDGARLAELAGKALFDHMGRGYKDNEIIDFPEHDDLCIKIEEAPDYIY